MLKRSAVILLLFFPSVASFSLPHLAVLEIITAAGLDPTVSKLLTSKIEEEFVNSGEYQVLDRADIEQVLKEKEFQFSYDLVKNEEIRRAGEYLGADFVVTAHASRIGKTYVITAKMINVETGAIAAQTSAQLQGTIDVLLNLSQKVGHQLALAGAARAVVEKSEEPPQQERPRIEDTEQTETVTEKPVPAAAPEKVEANSVVGVVAGWNVVGISGDGFHFVYSSEYDSVGSPYQNQGLIAGAFYETLLTEYIKMYGEIVYTKKGYRVDLHDYLMNELDESVDMGNVTSVFNYEYLEMPLLIKLGLPGSFSPYVAAGAAFSIWLGGTEENIYKDSASFRNA